MKIGVLALQGAFAEHINLLRRLGVEAVEVRLPQELADLDGLIIPGGESTTIGKLAELYRANGQAARAAHCACGIGKIDRAGGRPHRAAWRSDAAGTFQRLRVWELLCSCRIRIKRTCQNQQQGQNGER